MVTCYFYHLPLHYCTPTCPPSGRTGPTLPCAIAFCLPACSFCTCSNHLQFCYDHPHSYLAPGGTCACFLGLDIVTLHCFTYTIFPSFVPLPNCLPCTQTDRNMPFLFSPHPCLPILPRAPNSATTQFLQLLPPVNTPLPFVVVCDFDSHPRLILLLHTTRFPTPTWFLYLMVSLYTFLLVSIFLYTPPAHYLPTQVEDILRLIPACLP